MSLPQSFLLRPGQQATGTEQQSKRCSSTSTRNHIAAFTSSSSFCSSSSALPPLSTTTTTTATTEPPFRSIQFSFSGQENEIALQPPPAKKPLLSILTTSPNIPLTRHNMFDRNGHRTQTVTGRLTNMNATTAANTTTATTTLRRSIRVSPFQPLIHQRNMPRHGTISPLKVREYHDEQQKQQQQQLSPALDGRFDDTDEAAVSPSAASRPPLEVQVPHSSPFADNTTFMSPLMGDDDADYKALYEQSQRELRALQKLQERTREENHQLRARLQQVLCRRLEQRQVVPPPPPPPASTQLAQLALRPAPAPSSPHMTIATTTKDTNNTTPTPTTMQRTTHLFQARSWLVKTTHGTVPRRPPTVQREQTAMPERRRASDDETEMETVRRSSPR